MNAQRHGVLFLLPLLGLAAAGSLSAESAAPPDAAKPPEVTISAEDLSPLLEPIRAKHRIPGMVCGILAGDQLRLGAAGVRKAGAPEPITTGDLLHLGSCTKAMTATLIATLVEQKKLAWEARLSHLFPDLKPEMSEDFQTITLQQLLTHRSGLPSNGPWLELGRNASTTAQRLNLLKKMMQGELKSEPGRKFLYSNAGYALAGLMAEQVTGEAWEKLMRERLFGPLGMASAGFGAPGTPGKVDQPWGHVVKPDGPEGRQADNAPGAGPAGRVHCTMTDWAKFVNLHLHAARGDARMLKAETSTHLHTPSPGTDYACGWIITKRPWADGTVLTHNGSNTMWYAVVWIAPKKDLAVLVVANQGDKEAEKACDDTAGALIGHQLK